MRVLGLNGIGSVPALLRDESGDVQRDSGEEEYCAKNPSECAMQEARWHKPFQRKRRSDWQNE